MKKLLFLAILGTSFNLCADRFQTDSERTHELIQDLTENLRNIRMELRELNKYKMDIMEYLRRINDVVQQYKQEIFTNESSFDNQK